ncbi:sensor histidine kinase [Mesorhizobium sp.]|uniref:sensor histidine kinase n=1 Tax=Mesorhizobium sp. TaxID=1871066 RepID=UPI000FE8239C|nr:MASE4 domain-containing protein [Mesorhizobium sp.]RWI15204.1 MAG: two-component sensor histidine kinase [Mesorhizobium sp.]RWK45941.1 MAG: two-component sensor histidine kinase [Mesorhizobium sp.]RWK88696.1 MAG: two-component sensor histidine kinase [Mesorhizobium sp.]TIP57328.1 MAG: two-component sensor histidine kinase [Mesorhizobium sp.]TIQ18068.1 MAG: two-component sensor histidine kinase [Mesorhizobium sp.]
MERTAVTVPEDDFFVLSSLPPSRAQKQLALVFVLGLLAVYVLITVGPFSGIHPSRVDAFVPAYATAMFVNDSITAILLYTQFSILRSRATLLIASGYLFTALMLIPFVLAFPGLFTPKGGLVGGMQSTSWIYFFQHAGFPLFVIGYALSKGSNPSKRFWRGTVRAEITLSVALTAAVVLLASFFFIAGEALLPRVTLDSTRLSPVWPYVGAPVALLSIAAMVVLWIRRHSMLDLWLMVVMLLFTIEMPLSYYPDPARFSLGWYTVRIFGVLSSGLVLMVLLHEITTLYTRLLGAVRGQRHEREARLVTGDAVAATVAHEVKQPLSGMITSADAGLRFLGRSMPDLEEAKEAFKQIIAGGHRAAAVIDGIRTIFKKEDRKRAPLDLNSLIGETLALVREGLAKHRIMVEAELDERLPRVTGDRIQLQQLLVNLITNAIDSMAAVGGARVLSVKSKLHDDGHVTVSVADTGAGIGPQDVNRIFNPLFTTKPDGMGMGLSICRSIVEAHDGRLWVAPNTPRGAIFHFSATRSVSA